MAQIRASFQDAPFRTQRMLEWMMVALVIMLLALVFAHKVRRVQGQVELAAVQLMLGTLRTTFVIDYADRNAQAWAAPAAPPQTNPFKLLQRYPANYLGEMNAEQALATALAGGWVFDPECLCVGYLPMDTEWLDSPSGDLMAWYRVSDGPGPLQLTAKENYRWQGQALN